MPRAPRQLAHPTVLHLSLGRWSRHNVFSPGDEAVFVLRFLRFPSPYADNSGWDFPSAQVMVWRETVESGITYVSPTMRRKLLPNGFTRFDVSVPIGEGTEWLSNHVVIFRVTNGTGVTSIYLPDGIQVIAREYSERIQIESVV